MFNSRLDERRGAHEALHRGQGLAWPAEFIVHTFKAFFGGGEDRAKHSLGLVLQLSQHFSRSMPMEIHSAVWT